MKYRYRTRFWEAGPGLEKDRRQARIVFDEYFGYQKADLSGVEPEQPRDSYSRRVSQESEREQPRASYSRRISEECDREQPRAYSRRVSEEHRSSAPGEREQPGGRVSSRSRRVPQESRPPMPEYLPPPEPAAPESSSHSNGKQKVPAPFPIREKTSDSRPGSGKARPELDGIGPTASSRPVTREPSRRNEVEVPLDEWDGEVKVLTSMRAQKKTAKAIPPNVAVPVFEMSRGSSPSGLRKSSSPDSDVFLSDDMRDALAAGMGNDTSRSSHEVTPPRHSPNNPQDVEGGSLFDTSPASTPRSFDAFSPCEHGIDSERHFNFRTEGWGVQPEESRKSNRFDPRARDDEKGCDDTGYKVANANYAAARAVRSPSPRTRARPPMIRSPSPTHTSMSIPFTNIDMSGIKTPSIMSYHVGEEAISPSRRHPFAMNPEIDTIKEDTRYSSHWNVSTRYDPRGSGHEGSQKEGYLCLCE